MKLHLGVIGTGAFAQVCHIPGLQSHPQAKVVALCGRDYQRTRAMADRFGIPDVYTDYRELCARGDIDAVTIVTPNVFHAKQTLAALRNGKHVFCEKPLAMTVDEASAMLRAAEASQKIHQIGFTFRYLFGVRELRRRVQTGEIGRPYYLRVQYDGWDGLQPDWQVGWREKRDLAGGGVLYDVGSHLFDIARYILGPLEATTGFCHHIPRQRIEARTGERTDVETDDIAAAWFRFKNGVRGHWFASRATPPQANHGHLQVIGHEGALQARLSRGSLDWLQISRPTKSEWEELPLPSEAKDGTPHALAMMMRSFADACLRGQIDTTLDASFYDGLAAQRGIAAVLQANTALEWVRIGDDL